MKRRTFVRWSAPAAVFSLAGCLSSDQSETEAIVGDGKLRLRNQSGGEIVLEYGLVNEGVGIEEADLARQELTLDGDQAEIVYPEKTDGPYRFVVTAPDRDWAPIEQQWTLANCIDLTVTVTALPEMLNISSLSCVAGPDR
jgi:hypothetical protein